MWGIRLADSVHLHDMGFIPAHAGNTVPYGHVPGLCQVHPRSRGEYLSPVFLNLLISGSSRSRVEYSCTLLKFPDLRFSPRSRGNTLLNQLNQSWYRFTRSRGEYCPGKLFTPIHRFTPLTRGIPCEDDRHDGTSRFTPAHAGNTWKYKNIRGATRFTPAHAGIHRDDLQALLQVGSPLTRGIQH